MRRVVVTGLGIVSSIGNNQTEVLASLKAGKSGITFNEAMAEHGFRSQIAGAVDLDVKEHVDKRTLRFMGPGAAYAHIAMGQAIADAGLEQKDVINPMTGVVEGFRWALLGTDTQPGPILIVSSIFALILCMSGLYYFRRMEKYFADVEDILISIFNRQLSQA